MQRIFYISTKRLVIKSIKEEHFADHYALQSDQDVMRYIGDGKVRTKQQALYTMGLMLGHQERHGFSLGTVCTKEGEFVGRAGLIHLAFDNSSNDVEVGYALHKRFWGQGLATETASACLRWAKDNIFGKNFVAVTQHDNIASQRVIEKMGMRYSKDIDYGSWGVMARYYEL